jgi:hypothetical protein
MWVPEEMAQPPEDGDGGRVTTQATLTPLKHRCTLASDFGLAHLEHGLGHAKEVRG